MGEEKETKDLKEKTEPKNANGEAKIRRLDKKLARIQKSTKTLFPFMRRPHDKLRQKSRFYYWWHLIPGIRQIHWTTALAWIVVIALIVGPILFYVPLTVHAVTYTKTWTTKADWETGTARNQVDTATSEGDVLLAANPSPAISMKGWFGKDNTGGIGWHDPGSGKTGAAGTGDGAFDTSQNSPTGVTLDSSGNIYVSDQYNYRIQVFQNNGTLLGWFGKDNTGGIGWHDPGSGKTGASGTENGAFWQSVGVAVDSSSYIYTTEFNANERVQVFQDNGTFVRKFGSFGSGDRQFYSARDLDIDSSDNIYVADSQNYRIQVFQNNGTLLGWFGKDNTGGIGWHDPGSGKTGASGSGDGQFNSPRGITVDSSGNIYVADSSNNRIQVFTNMGTFIRKFGSSGSGDGQFTLPRDLELDSLGYIYIADTGNNRVQVLNNAWPYYLSGTISDLIHDAGGTAVWSKLGWSGDFPAGTSVKYRAKTSDNGTDWSAWSDYYTDTEAPYEVNLSIADSAYINIEMTLEGGNETPTINDLTLTYIINGPPSVSNVTASQGSNNLVSAAYDISDPDSATATVRLFYNDSATNTAQVMTASSPATGEGLNISATAHLPNSGALQIGNEYISYTGKTVNSVTGITRAALTTKAAAHNNSTAVWTLCQNTTGTGVKATGAQTRHYTAAWTASADLDEVYLNNTARLKVSAHDGEQANMVGSADSSAFTLDTKNPTNPRFSFAGSETQGKVNITGLAADDDATIIQMRLSTRANFSGSSWETYAAAKSNFDAGGGSTIYAKFKDQYGNESDAVSHYVPGVPGNPKVLDASAPDAGIYKVLITWDTVSGSNGYKVEKSTTDMNPSSFSVVGTLSSSSNFVFGDTDVTQGQTYYYRLRSTSGDGQVYTSNPSDIVYVEPAFLPEISGIQADGATIAWETDVATDSYVQYGTTMSYGEMTGNDSKTTTHSITLTGLDGSTTYHCRIRATDEAGHTAYSEDFAFTTPETPDTSRPVISGAIDAAVEGDSAAISWRTDKDSNSMVEYGASANYGTESGQEGEYGRNHQVTIVNLNPATTYHYRVKSRDQAGNVGTSDDNTFTTKNKAAVRNVSASETTFDSTIISWETTTVATTLLHYGTDKDNLNQNAGDESTGATTKHALKLDSLSEGTTYYFRISGHDEAGREVASDDYSFSTLAKPIISEVNISDVGSIKALITWKTNTPCDSVVSFSSADTPEQDTGSSALTADHSVTLANLKPSTTYTVKVKSRDAYGNQAVSDPQSITTIADTTPPKIVESKIETQLVKTAENEDKVQAIVSWQTDEPATSQVLFAKGVAAPSGGNYPNQTQVSESLTSSHVVILPGLDPASTYHVQMISKDSSDNTGASDDNSFITLRKGVSWISRIVNVLEETFGWVKNLRWFGK